MGNMSTFGTFTLARLGIYASQHALNVTGNNISNINTKGYTRQELDQTSMYYGTADRYHSRFDIRGNGGVLPTGIDQSRDKYLDIRYRNEMTRAGTMDSALGCYKRLSDIFDEVAAGEDGEGVLEARFNDFIQQMELLGRDESAGKDDIDFIVRDAAEALVIQFNDYANQLRNLRADEVSMLQDEISETNNILTKIRDLNESIRRAQIFGGSALTQRDERNLLIDELSEKMGISVHYVAEDLGDGVEVEKLRISTSGDPTRVLVDGLYTTQLSLRDQDGFGINLSALKDGKGREDPTTYNGLDNDVPSGDPTPAGDGAGTQFTKAKAEGLAEYMNALEKYTDPANTGTAVYQYGIKSAGSEKYVVTRSLADGSGTTELTLDTKPLYEAAGSVTPVGTDASKATTFSTQADAQEVVDYLNANREFTQKGDKTYVFHAVQNPNDANSWLIGRHDVTGDKTLADTECIYTSVTMVRQTKLTDTELTGGIQARREILTEKGAYATQEDLEEDKNAATKRGIPYYQKALDTLANTFARMMNEANTLQLSDCFYMNDEGEFTDADGNVLPDQSDSSTFVLRDPGFEKYFEKDPVMDPNDPTQYLLDADGKVVLSDDYALDSDGKPRFNDLYKKYFGGTLFSNDPTTNDDGTGAGSEPITAANISISLGWAEGWMHVLPTKDPDAVNKSRAQDNTARMISMLNGRHQFTVSTGGQGDTFFEGKFQEMLTDTIAGSLAKDQSITSTMLKNYTAAADELYIDRDAIMGVDLNDEAMNMMQFQKAYSAACRLMTTFDDMLDRLINGTAV